MDANSKPAKKWLVPALLAVVVLLLGVILVVVLRLGNGAEDEATVTDSAAPQLGYAEGVTVVEDPDALQKAVDEMYMKAAEGEIALEYKNDATSEDGTTFSCYIANSVSNSYDMYIQIFADAELTDELYLSGLLRPGTAFDTITLNHALDPGSNTVYVAFTQVEKDLASIHAQVFVTMNFNVTA